MADARDDAAHRQARRRGAVFRRGAGARLGGTAVSGRLAVVGLGPGDARWLTPEAEAALAAADALYGYGPYLDRVPARAGQSRHASDNREERARAAAALDHAARGRAASRVVSGGDPGVFAMAAAVCEAIEAGPASLARARRRDRAGHHRDARRRRARRRAARPRFLRALALRQSQAVGADRAPARRGGDGAAS